MKSNVYARRNAAWQERQQQMLGAGLMSERFPGVASIVVTLDYARGVVSPVHRTLNFYPGSHAFFKITPLGNGVDEEGLNLTRFIGKMIAVRERSAKGGCTHGRKDPEIAHSSIDYEVAITYS